MPTWFKIKINLVNGNPGKINLGYRYGNVNAEASTRDTRVCDCSQWASQHQCRQTSSDIKSPETSSG